MHLLQKDNTGKKRQTYCMGQQTFNCLLKAPDHDPSSTPIPAKTVSPLAQAHSTQWTLLFLPGLALLWNTSCYLLCEWSSLHRKQQIPIIRNCSETWGLNSEEKSGRGIGKIPAAIHHWQHLHWFVCPSPLSLSVLISVYKQDLNTMKTWH